MKAHWQRAMLVSGLALIGWAMVAFSVQASTPQDQRTRRETPARVSAPINTAPVSGTTLYTWYFPIISGRLACCMAPSPSMVCP